MAWVAVVRDCIQACHQFGVAELHGLSLMACDDVRDLAGLVAKCLVSCTSYFVFAAASKGRVACFACLLCHLYRLVVPPTPPLETVEQAC